MNLSPHLLCEEETHPRGKILRFAGEADFIAVPAVRQLLKRLLGQRIPFLIVDLSARDVLEHTILGGPPTLPD